MIITIGIRARCIMSPDGSAELSILDVPPEMVHLSDIPTVWRHTSLEGMCIQPHTFKPRSARVISFLIKPLTSNLVRRAQDDSKGDQKLLRILVERRLSQFLGTRLGAFFSDLALPHAPSPINLSNKDGMTKTTTQAGAANPSTFIPPFAAPANLSSYYTREDEI